MVVSPEEIERHINKICWGGRFAFVEDEQGETITIIIKSLSLKDRNFVDFIYEKALEEARDSGVSTRLEIRNELKVKQIWTEDDEKRIIEDTEKIEVLEKEVKRLIPKSRAFKITENLLGSLKKNLMALFGSSIEDYAEETKSSAIVYCSTYDEHENRFWKSYDDFEEEKDQHLIGSIVRQLNKILLLETAEVRAIARAPSWRFRWNAGKSLGGLFKDGILDLSTSQQSLVYWSQVYDNVYESHDRPDDSIIENDDKLDKWFKSKEVERKKEKAISGGEVDGIKLSNRMSSHGEIFVITNPNMSPASPYRDKPSVPTNEDVENLNSPLVKKFKQVEQQKIKEKKTIDETRLRSRKDRLSRKIIGSNAAVLDKGSLSGRSKGKNRKILPGESIG